MTATDPPYPLLCCRLATNTFVFHARKANLNCYIKNRLLKSAVAECKSFHDQGKLTCIYMTVLQIITSLCTPVKTSTLLVLLVMLCHAVF